MMALKTVRLGTALVLIALLSLGIFLTQSDDSAPIKAGDGRPNIILIVTDDQDISSLQHMPRTMDVLARRGVVFSSAFVASPVCVPSRVSILRGQYLHNHNVMELAEFSRRRLDTATIATVLKSAGYRTALVGKYLGPGTQDTIPPGWDVWQTMLTHNVYFNYQFNENGKRVFYGARPEDYISSVLKAKILEFVGKGGKRDPFFLYIGTVAPHAPATPPPGREKAFSAVVKVPSLEQDVSDKPEWVREFRARNSDRPGIRSPAKGTERRVEWYRNRLRTLVSVDEMVGELSEALSAAGAADNTYIFYVSDNSDWVSAHYPASAKLSPYDDGIHVPFLVTGPAVEAGAERSEIVSTVDLLPTFAELAGISAPDFADGRSLVPLLRRETASQAAWRNSVVAELGLIAEWPWASTPPPYRLLRSATFKYIEYSNGEREYYDLRTDPGEMENVYATLDGQRRTDLARQMNRAAPWSLFPGNDGR